MSFENPNTNDEPVFDARERRHRIFKAEGAPHLHDELKETNAAEHHVSNLFDENETRFGGDRIDLATGKPIDNASSNTLDGLEVHDVLTPLEEEDDEAAKWLRENDPNLKKKH